MNSYFQFKQFTIQQDKCAMKVCTDACLFAAWVAKKLEKKEIVANKIMDIGCGTGLLSLMLAQKTSAQIDAIEINADAFLQATENIEASPFKNQVHTFHGPVALFAAHEKYDFIISNPPFYVNQLKSPKADKNAAMHDTGLSLENLMLAIKNNLSITGKAAILLPFESIADFENIVTANSFFITERLNVKHSPTHAYFRSIIIISTVQILIKETDISIKEVDGSYSNDFIDLLKSYYLHF
jgi:tRNA1Val (adenine37-N6)-methyltransferase